MSLAAVRPSSAAIRVLLVDDSAIVRGMVSRWLQDAPGIKVVGMAVDGAQALKALAATEADVCLLDVEMPVMSGLDALPRLLALRPGLRVIMASTLTERGAETTLRALQLGAADFIPKPSANRLGGADAYRDSLIGKIRSLAPKTRAAERQAAPAAPAPAAPVGTPVRERRCFPRPDVLVVAASTGGPPALRQLFAELGDRWKGPVLIAQHMPPEFTRTLARMIDQATPLRAKEAEAGEPVLPGVIYVAPGDFHLTVRRSAGGGVIVNLDQNPQVNWCRPSADPLFRSATEVWGDRALGLVLTGMGHDGRDGARALFDRGGRILAQDEASSVVWGMPGAVVEAGLADRILPLSEIASCVAALAGGGAA